MFNSYYTTGTVTITSGSPNFTTSGAALQTAGIRPGDIILRNGLALVIATITGQNSGTLTANAPAGAAGTGQPLRIALQTDASRLAAAQADLIALLSGGNAQALAGLNLIANRGLYADGAGSLNLFNQTTFGRAIQSLTGANGSFIRATGANAAVMQAIVGTVSQSGGVPTGALMESGSNVNGRYWRFASGLQVCVLREASVSVAAITAVGSIFRDLTLPSWTYPAIFAEQPAAFFTFSGNAMWGLTSPGFSNTGRTAVSPVSLSANPAATNLAVGRWF